MDYINKHFIKIVFLFLFLFAYHCSSAQMWDVVVLDNDTMHIYTDPLESLTNKGAKPKSYFDKDTCSVTKCPKGYFGEWLIEEDQLFLKNLYNCCYGSDSVKADLKKCFVKKFKKEKVFADWYSDKLLAHKGKILFKNDDPAESVYEKEIEYTISKGIVVGTKKFDNTKTKVSQYYTSSALLMEFLESNVNWGKIPALKDRILFVDISFSANEQGNIDKVICKKKDFDQLYYDEAIRVVKKIPDWNVLYLHGQFFKKEYSYTLEFSEELRKKYKK